MGEEIVLARELQLTRLAAEREKAEKKKADEKRAVLQLAGSFGFAEEGESKARRGTSAKTAIDPRRLVEEYCRSLAPRPRETPDMMFFRYWGTNPFVEAAVDPLSTFAVDVDTASYTLMRKYLTDRGLVPPTQAIRTEEFLNYFNYEYPAPTEDEGAFAVHTEMAPSPFAHEPEYQLLKVGIKGRVVTNEKRQRCALVFVVDTSGSMARETRLELVKDGLRLLVRELDEGDSIGIVAFDRTSRTILEPTPADQQEKILNAINTLHPRRNTNVDSGLTAGYQMAALNFAKDGTNRVLLLSDGVANTGVTNVGGMLSNVRAQRERGIFLTCVGVGMGNHNDTLLETRPSHPIKMPPRLDSSPDWGLCAELGRIAHQELIRLGLAVGAYHRLEWPDSGVILVNGAYSREFGFRRRAKVRVQGARIYIGRDRVGFFR